MLKWMRYLISMFLRKILLEKRKTNFPRLYLMACFFSHYGIIKNNDHNRQNLLRSIHRISMTWFLIISILEERCEPNIAFRKQKSYQKGTFDSTKIVSKHGLGWNLSPFFLKLHIQFWKCFCSMILYNVGKDYYKVYGARFFFSKTFLTRLLMCF